VTEDRATERPAITGFWTVDRDPDLAEPREPVVAIYGPDGDEIATAQDNLGLDWTADEVASRIVEAVNAYDRLRAIEAAARALMAANCGDGHPGEAHDRLLHEIEQHDESCSGSYIHDCSNCGGQMYGTESDLRDLLDPTTTEPKEPE
jgi:hypothetical protein